MKLYNKIFLGAFVLMACQVASAVNFDNGYLNYDSGTASGDNVYVKGFASSAPATVKDLVIPRTVEQGGRTYNVVGVLANAFTGSRLTGDLTINLTSGNTAQVAANAFYNCTGLNGTIYLYSNSSAAAFGGGYFGSLKANAFNGCPNVKEIVFVGSINANFTAAAFKGFSSLEKIIYVGKSMTYNWNGDFEDNILNAQLYVPEDLMANVPNLAGWNKFKKPVLASETLLTKFEVPEAYYLPTWVKQSDSDPNSRYDITDQVVIEPFYLSPLLESKNTKGTVRFGNSSLYTYYNLYIPLKAYEENYYEEVELPISIGRGPNATTKTITVYLGQKEVPAKDVVVTIRYNANSGFALRYKAKSTDALDFYVNSYGGFNYSKIEKYNTEELDAAPSTAKVIENVDIDKNGLHHEDAIGENNLSFVVKAAAGKDENGQPTVGVTDAVAGSSVSLTVDGKNVVIEGAQAEDIVYVYNIAGALLYSGNDKSFTLGESGIYVVNVAGQSFKVAVR